MTQLFQQYQRAIKDRYKKASKQPKPNMASMEALMTAPDKLTVAIEGSPRQPGMFLWPVTAKDHKEAWEIAKRRPWYAGVDKRLTPSRSRGKYWFQSKVVPNVI